MFNKSIHSKILALVIGVISVGTIATIYAEQAFEREELLAEKLRSSRLMSAPILHSIYEDMLEERADLARHLIDAMADVEGVERVQIIRGNGVEAAFQDMKTIEAVREEYGEVLDEWTADHRDLEVNVAEGVEDPGFKEAYSHFEAMTLSEERYYIEENGTGEKPLFTYLMPIVKKKKCSACHATEGARGILMITTSLEEMYTALAESRNKRILMGFVIIGTIGFFLSAIIRRFITGPIEQTVGVIKRISEGKTGTSERVDETSRDEIGYLATAFNGMIDSIGKRDEEKWISTFDAIQDYIAIEDKDFRILRANKALANKLNLQPEELIGKRCYDVLGCGDCPPINCPNMDTMERHMPSTVELTDLTIDGTYQETTFPMVNEEGEVWASVHVIRDVTKEKVLREQLLHAEKVSSMGKFVAGITHELNNPLMGIMGFSQILMDTSGDKKLSDVKDKLQKIYNESVRTSKIVQNLLTFARARKAERSFNKINEIIEKTIELREYSLKTNNIEVVAKLSGDIPGTMVDFYQIQQVFVNVINNAADAMVEANGKGTLTIVSRVRGSSIFITFTDDGPGVDEDIIGNVFDPFFTTKEVGKGTGLGLSITHGIILEHGGTVRMENVRGGPGTVVSVSIPIVGEDMEAPKAMNGIRGVASRSEAAGGAKEVAQSKETVLVVDDEKSIRETLRDILNVEGYDVLVAVDGDEALELLADQVVDLVITDIKMPGLGGKELYEAIMERHEYLVNKVIFLTGDVFSVEVKEFIDGIKAPCILKPFKIDELLEIVVTLLEIGKKRG